MADRYEILGIHYGAGTEPNGMQPIEGVPAGKIALRIRHFVGNQTVDEDLLIPELPSMIPKDQYTLHAFVAQDIEKRQAEIKKGNIEADKSKFIEKQSEQVVDNV